VFIYLYIYVCAKYSDFLCIWLRKCDFLTEKLGTGRIRIRNDLFRIRIWILQKVPDPTGSGSRSGSRSGSGSTTLVRSADPKPDPRQHVIDPQHCSEVSRIRAHISQLQPLAAMMGLELVSADRTRLLQAASRIGIDPVLSRIFNSIQQIFIGIVDKYGNMRV
jgi:hypothetical protein